MKKVVAIMGSPRKNGNGAQMTKVIEEELTHLGDIEFTYLFLKDLNLEVCLGCSLCFKRGEENCPFYEKKKNIIKQFDEADGIIFVSSVYSYHINALLKNFIDHYSYLIHRPRFFGKAALIFVVRGDLFKESKNYLKKIAKNWGFNVVTTTGPVEIASVNNKHKIKITNSLKNSTRKFHNALYKTNMVSPKLYDLIFFNIWKLNALNLKEEFIADYIYWKEKGWLHEDYYYPVRINILKRTIALIITKIAVLFMRKVFGGYEIWLNGEQKREKKN